MTEVTWVTSEFGIVCYDNSIEIVQAVEFANTFDEAYMKAQEMQAERGWQPEEQEREVPA